MPRYKRSSRRDSTGEGVDGKNQARKTSAVHKKTPSLRTSRETIAGTIQGNAALIESALEALSRFPVPGPAEPLSQGTANQFELCTPPSIRTAPQFLVPFRRAIVFPDLCLPVDLEGTSVGDPDNPHLPFGPLLFNCVKPTKVTFCLSLDLRFEQSWNLTGLSIGDLSSTMALAPSEELVLEFQSSQRRVLEQNRVDSAEEMDSTESVTVDKEVVNTVQSLSKTQEWHIDGSASYGIPSKLSVEARAGFRQSTTETSQTTIDHTSEVTNKSAHNLKTLHKIEVRGVSEGLVQNRLTRKIKNPYPDQTLSLNVFQLLKHFDVQTLLSEIRPVFLLQIDGFVFDSDFVVTNTDFLRDTLLDPALVDDLPAALLGADPLPQQDLTKAREAAKQALHYLFDEVIIFNIKDDRTLSAQPGNPPVPQDPANSPRVGFDAGRTVVFSTGNVNGFPIQTQVRGFPQGSALGDAITNNLGPIFTSLAFFYKVYQDIKGDPNAEKLLDNQAIALTSAVDDFAGKQWRTLVEASLGNVQQIDNDGNTINRVIRNILDNDSLTEIFRRLSGFVAMVDEMVKPIGGTTDAEKQTVQDQAKAFQTLERLLQHLRCNSNYYTQQFLVYRTAKTKNQAVVDFVADVLNRVSVLVPALTFVQKAAFDAEHPFIDKQQIIVPGLRVFTEDQITELGGALGSDDGAFSLGDITPAVLRDVQVPADGIHLEVAKGGCVLADVPAQPSTSLDVAVHDASLKLQSST